MSTGLAIDASGGQRLGEARAAWPRRAAGSRSPSASQASAHRIPGPPALVSTATRSPRGSGWRASTPATSNISPTVSARITPACANSASTVDVRGGEQRAGVRRGGALAGRRAAALDGDDRLVLRDPPRDPPELARVAERLEVEQDHVGVGVLLPVLQEVVAGEVGLVADRDERREADAARRRLVDRGDPERAALRREGDAARACGSPGANVAFSETGVIGVGDAEAVRADEAHARGAADRRAARPGARRPRRRPRRSRPRGRPARARRGAPHCRAVSTTAAAGTAMTASSTSLLDLGDRADRRPPGDLAALRR